MKEGECLFQKIDATKLVRSQIFQTVRLPQRYNGNLTTRSELSAALFHVLGNGCSEKKASLLYFTTEAQVETEKDKKNNWIPIDRLSE